MVRDRSHVHLKLWGGDWRSLCSTWTRRCSTSSSSSSSDVADVFDRSLIKNVSCLHRHRDKTLNFTVVVTGQGGGESGGERERRGERECPHSTVMHSLTLGTMEKWCHGAAALRGRPRTLDSLSAQKCKENNLERWDQEDGGIKKR